LLALDKRDLLRDQQKADGMDGLFNPKMEGIIGRKNSYFKGIDLNKVIKNYF